MEREQFIKFIPKPDNKDVILYDISLSDLIDLDVFQEYNKLYPIFINKKERYIFLKKVFEEYQSTINNIYLFKPSWSEEDYLQSLKDYKKNYSIVFGEIKKIENNIKMLQKNLQGINEKINFQTAKEEKQINNKKENINISIDKNKERMLNLKNFLDSYKLSLQNIEDQIIDNEEEFQILADMQSKLKEGKFKCEYCGRTIKSTSEDSLIYKRLTNNIEKNKNKLEKILKQKEKIELNISYYNSELIKVKNDLNNDIAFKKENYNFYKKKSIEILKLEALRDEILNNISSLEKQLKSNPKIKTKQYLDLKDNIKNCELSLINLKKIKEIKEQQKNEIEEFNELKKELKNMLEKLEKYIKFISIYFKIIEQKANEYCGNDFKFKFFKIEENYKFVPYFNIIYKGINYWELDSKDKKEVDKILIEKFSIYF